MLGRRGACIYDKIFLACATEGCDAWFSMNGAWTNPVNHFFLFFWPPGVFAIPSQNTYLHTHSLSLNHPLPSFQILNRQGLGGSERVGHQTRGGGGGFSQSLDHNLYCWKKKKKRWRSMSRLHISVLVVVFFFFFFFFRGYASFSLPASLVFFFFVGFGFWVLVGEFEDFCVSCHPVTLLGIGLHTINKQQLNWTDTGAKWCDWYRTLDHVLYISVEAVNVQPCLFVFISFFSELSFFFIIYKVTLGCPTYLPNPRGRRKSLTWPALFIDRPRLNSPPLASLHSLLTSSLDRQLSRSF